MALEQREQLRHRVTSQLLDTFNQDDRVKNEQDVAAHMPSSFGASMPHNNALAQEKLADNLLTDIASIVLQDHQQPGPSSQ